MRYTDRRKSLLLRQQILFWRATAETLYRRRNNWILIKKSKLLGSLFQVSWKLPFLSSDFGTCEETLTLVRFSLGTLLIYKNISLLFLSHWHGALSRAAFPEPRLAFSSRHRPAIYRSSAETQVLSTGILYLPPKCGGFAAARLLPPGQLSGRILEPLTCLFSCFATAL